MSQDFFSATDFAKATRFLSLQKLGPEDFSSYLTFSTKEEYLGWRQEWRDANIDLIRQIKATKADLHRPHVQPASAIKMGELVNLRHKSTALRYLRMASRIRAGMQRASQLQKA